MKSKSKSGVLSVLAQDPSSKEGMTNVLQSFMPYVPTISECKNVRARTLVQGTNFKILPKSKYGPLQVTKGSSRWCTVRCLVGLTSALPRKG